MDHLATTGINIGPTITDQDLVRYCGPHTPPRTDLVAVLQHWAQVRPDRVAFYFTDGDNPDADLQITFAELDEAARNVAGYLQKYGKVTPGARVLLIYPPVLDFVVGFFGCLYAGATAVPAFPPRRNRKGQRIHSIAQDCQAHVALTNSHVRQQIEGDANWVEWESISIVATDVLSGRDHAAEWEPPKIDEGDLAVLQYTSGSTGDPKGVMLSHGNLVRNCELIMVAFEPDPSSVGVSWLPTYHDMGLV
ncbi:MAG: fatty acyl-AMP ligase, partial [Planctomycetota bacterium]